MDPPALRAGDRQPHPALLWWGQGNPRGRRYRGLAWSAKEHRSERRLSPRLCWGPANAAPSAELSPTVQTGTAQTPLLGQAKGCAPSPASAPPTPAGSCSSASSASSPAVLDRAPGRSLGLPPPCHQPGWQSCLTAVPRCHIRIPRTCTRCPAAACSPRTQHSPGTTAAGTWGLWAP